MKETFELTPCITLRKTLRVSNVILYSNSLFSLIVAVNVIVKEYRKLICLKDDITPQ